MGGQNAVEPQSDLRRRRQPGPRWTLDRLWPAMLSGPVALQMVVAAGATHGAPLAPKLPSADCAAAAEAARQQEAGLLAAAPRLKVVLLGEIHTSAADHAWQLRSLETLAQLQRPITLGLEMVPAARQPILSRFATGQLDEANFLAKVDWPRIWGHDPELYLPLLRWARRQGVPLLALNIEPEVVRRVRQAGLKGIPAAEREGIGIPAPAGTAYRQQLRAAWQAHRALSQGTGETLSSAERDDLERFLASQLLRDRAMAERLVAAHRRNPSQLVVALMGRGHLAEGDGMTGQLRHLGLSSVLALHRPELPESCGPPPAGARLGAYLESADGAVWVRRVAPGSAAAAAGLQLGDRVLAVNGEPVQRAGQVIRLVRQQPAGVPLQLLIERASRRLRVEVRLAPTPAGWPGRMGGHPLLGRPPTT
jgi:uncharacterized iron-regulated protein